MLRAAQMLVWPPYRNKTMILLPQHMMTTLLIAMLLHGGFAWWFSLLKPAPLPTPAEPPLRINMLATIAETSVNSPPEIVELPQPVPEKPTPVIPPPPLRDIVKARSVELPPVVEIRPLKKVSEPVAQAALVTEVVQPPVPVESSAAPVDAVATARYEQLLAAWLEQHKKYPHRAKRLRIEGEAVLRIVIDRSGQMQQVSLVQRSGNRLLDKAALEMAQRANPFPPMPEKDLREQLEFVVPVAFMLR